MRDFDEFVLSLGDEDRRKMINSLRGAADRTDASRRSGSQDKRNEALRRCERFGRIIYFLLHRSHSDSATDADRALCQILAEKLQTKEDSYTPLWV